MTQPVTEPLRLSFDVACSARHAFEVWTFDIDDWWPVDHSVSAADGLRVMLEPDVGGRIYEVTRAGVEHEWGQVVTWDPPHRFGYLWHLRGDRADATEVQVCFEPLGERRTRVEIEHTGWERLGAHADAWRDRNRGGWSTCCRTSWLPPGPRRSVRTAGAGLPGGLDHPEVPAQRDRGRARLAARAGRLGRPGRGRREEGGQAGHPRGLGPRREQPGGLVRAI